MAALQAPAASQSSMSTPSPWLVPAQTLGWNSGETPKDSVPRLAREAVPGFSLEILAFLVVRAVLGLGIVGGRAVLSEAMELGVQAPGSPSSRLPCILLYSFTPQWEWGARDPPARKPFVSVRAAPLQTTQMNVYQAFIMATWSLATLHTESPPFLTTALGGGSYE